MVEYLKSKHPLSSYCAISWETATTFLLTFTLLPLICAFIQMPLIIFSSYFAENTGFYLQMPSFFPATLTFFSFFELIQASFIAILTKYHSLS